MPGQTLALADAVLKEDYGPSIKNQLNNSVKVAAQLDKNTEDIVGRRAVIPLVVGRNTGVGARKEGETKPVAGATQTIDAYVPCRYLYGAIRLTKQVITRMAKDRGAFEQSMVLETNELKGTTARDWNRQLWGTSDGRLAQCGTTAASATVQLQTTTPDAILILMREGVKVDIGTVAAPQTVASDRSVSAADLTNKTVTISGAVVTTTSSHYLFRQGNGGSGNDQREVTGLQTVVSASGTLFGVDPTSYPVWASHHEDASADRPVTQNLVEKAAHKAENLSGRTVDGLWAEDGVYRAAAAYLEAKHRIVNTLDLKGGHKGLEFNFGDASAALVRDRDAPVGVLVGLCYADLPEYVDEDWDFEDTGGGILQPSSDRTHSFEADYFTFRELGCTSRNSHFIITDLEQA